MTKKQDWLDLFLTRHSVRQFEQKPVSRMVLQRILEAAASAPSAHNAQPWRFVLLEDTQARTRLALAMAKVFRRDLVAEGYDQVAIEIKIKRSMDRIGSAPVAILLCLEEHVFINNSPKKKRHEFTMAVQSVAIAGGYLLLAAHAEGLAGYWMCAPLYAQRAVRTTLALPDHWQPQALLLIGYAKGLVPSPPKRSLQQIVVQR